MDFDQPYSTPLKPSQTPVVSDPEVSQTSVTSTQTGQPTSLQEPVIPFGESGSGAASVLSDTNSTDVPQSLREAAYPELKSAENQELQTDNQLEETSTEEFVMPQSLQPSIGDLNQENSLQGNNQQEELSDEFVIPQTLQKTLDNVYQDNKTSTSPAEEAPTINELEQEVQESDQVLPPQSLVQQADSTENLTPHKRPRTAKVLLALGPLFLLASLAVTLVLTNKLPEINKKPESYPANPSELVASSNQKEPTPFASTIGEYERKDNSDSSYDLFFKGVIQEVTEQEHAVQTIKLLSTAENNSNTIITFTLPRYPPKINQNIIGGHFKEMFEKGKKEVNIRVRYDKQKRFIEWEVLEDTNS